MWTPPEEALGVVLGCVVRCCSAAFWLCYGSVTQERGEEGLSAAAVAPASARRQQASAFPRLLAASSSPLARALPTLVQQTWTVRQRDTRKSLLLCEKKVPRLCCLGLRVDLDCFFKMQVTRPCGKGFPGSSVGKASSCNAGGPTLVPGSGRCTGEGLGYPLQYSRASPVAQLGKNLPTRRETWVWSLGWEDPLENGKATHSSIPAWRISWTVPTGSQRVGHDWATFTLTSGSVVQDHFPPLKWDAKRRLFLCEMATDLFQSDLQGHSL